MSEDESPSDPDSGLLSPGIKPVTPAPLGSVGQTTSLNPVLVPTEPLSQVAQVASAPSPGTVGLIPRNQGAWTLWWLCVITFGVYYFIWYGRINRELCAILKEPLKANGRWWNQLIPFWDLVGLGATAKRLNRAHAAVGSPTRVSVVTAWLWAVLWFGSQTRYLQRRINILHDVMTAKAVIA